MATNTFIKDPEASLDYEFDWSDWLETGDTIADYVLTVPNGLTQVSDSSTTTGVTVILSGGTAGICYDVECKITTAAGLIDERTMRIQCEER